MFKWLAPLTILWLMSAGPAAVRFERDFAPGEPWVKGAERPWRDDLCLNGSWQFQPVAVPGVWQRGSGSPPELAPPKPDGWSATPLRVPSHWNVNTWGGGREVGDGTARPYDPSSLYFPSYSAAWDTVDMGWLRRSFKPPAGWASHRIVLHFEAIAGEARVLVNGRQAGHHWDSWLPFELDITDLVRVGETNELLVGIRASRLWDVQRPGVDHLLAPYPVGSTTDGLSGIWQDVWLIALPPCRVTQTFVQPLVAADELRVDVELRNDGRDAVDLTVGGAVQPWISEAGSEILDAPEPRWRLAPAILALPAAKVTLAAGEQGKVSLHVRPRGALALWSPDEPNLYGLTIRVEANGRTLDSAYTRFGWRELTFAGSAVRLNGEPLTLRGDLLHPFGPSVTSRRNAWAWYRLIKDVHGNAARPHAQPHPRAYLDLADEMGVLVLDETAMFGSSLRLDYHDPQAWQRYTAHLEALVLRDRNHPSVLGWSWGNELFARRIYEPDLSAAEVDDWYRRLAEVGRVAERLDPTRPWRSCDGDEDVRGTQPVWNKHFGLGTPPVAELPLNLGKPLMVGEHGGTYFATAGQLARFDADAPYESYAGRNLALADDVYTTATTLAERYLAWYSPSELAWFGLEPLPLGYHERARLPDSGDGVVFGAFVEGQPGMQPERLPPYATTLNPGWDPSLPLYRPLAMVEAAQAAWAPGGPQQYGQPRSMGQASSSPESASGARVPLACFEAGWRAALSAIGVQVGQADTGGGPLLLDARATGPDDAAAAERVLAAGGAVLLAWPDGELTPAAAGLLPARAALTERSATGLVRVAEHPWTSGLRPADLYFAEDPFESRIIRHGLDGALAGVAECVLAASNTDWTLFNSRPESVKCAAVVLGEQLHKPSGACLLAVPVGSGHLLVTTLDPATRSLGGQAVWRRLLAAAGVAVGDAVASGPTAFDGAGALVRAMVAGPSDLAAAPRGSRAWRVFEALGQDRFNFSQLGPRPAGDGPWHVWLSCWLYSPMELGDLLGGWPAAGRVALLTYVADEGVVLVNGHELVPAATEAADYRTLARYERLPLHRGWNHLQMRLSSAELNGPRVGTLAARLIGDAALVRGLRSVAALDEPAP